MATNATVVITYDESARPDHQVTVSPSLQAIIEGQGTVTWTVNAPSGYSVVIEFVNGCPFASFSGAYSFSTSGLTTAPANVNTNGPWPYTITVWEGETKLIPPASHQVVVQGNP